MLPNNELKYAAEYQVKEWFTLKKYIKEYGSLVHVNIKPNSLDYVANLRIIKEFAQLGEDHNFQLLRFVVKEGTLEQFKYMCCTFPNIFDEMSYEIIHDSITNSKIFNYIREMYEEEYKYCKYEIFEDFINGRESEIRKGFKNCPKYIQVKIACRLKDITLLNSIDGHWDEKIEECIWYNWLEGVIESYHPNAKIDMSSYLENMEMYMWEDVGEWLTTNLINIINGIIKKNNHIFFSNILAHHYFLIQIYNILHFIKTFFYCE